LLLAPPVVVKDGKDGSSEDTDDHLLVPVPPLLLVPLGVLFACPDTVPLVVFFFRSRFAFCIKFFSSGGVLGLVLGRGGRGLIHFSRNLRTGRSATIVACEFGGELGKGR
jgi:hypothetical protein